MAKSKFDSALGSFKQIPQAQAGGVVKAIVKAAKAYGKTPGAKKVLSGVKSTPNKEAKKFFAKGTKTTAAKNSAGAKKQVISEKTKRDFLKGK